MTHRGPFQPLPFCDSVNRAQESLMHSLAASCTSMGSTMQINVMTVTDTGFYHLKACIQL